MDRAPACAEDRPALRAAPVVAHPRAALIGPGPGGPRAPLGARHDRRAAETPAALAAGDAPEAFIATQLKGIVGLEVAVTPITGTWQASQNRPAPDRAGVVAAPGARPLAAPIPAPAG